MKRISTITAAGFLALAGAAAASDAAEHAADPAMEGTASRAQTTTNATADEPISEKLMRVTFAKLDTDKNGRLAPDEVYMYPELSAIFPDADADRDGSLTQDEFMTLRTRRDQLRNALAP